MKTKFMLIAAFLSGIQLIPITSAYSQNNVDQKIYTDFANHGFSKIETDRILESIIDAFETVQYHISSIAAKNVSINERNRLKDETLKYFASPSSIIEVTSVNRPQAPARRLFISVYLERLMNLNYTTVTILFSDDYEVSKLFKNSKNEYEIGISVWQYFIARNADGIIVYADKTRKKAFFSVDKTNRLSDWVVKINEIKATETKKYYLIAED